MTDSLSWSRRAFLNTSVALAFAPLTIPVVADAGAMPRVHAVVVDRRFTELAAALQRKWSAWGPTIIPYVADMTRAWFDHVEPLWRSQPTATVAGVTSEQALFCFEQLCWDRRLRVVARQHVGHWPVADNERRESVFSWVIARPGVEWTRGQA